MDKCQLELLCPSAWLGIWIGRWDWQRLGQVRALSRSTRIDHFWPQLDTKWSSDTLSTSKALCLYKHLWAKKCKSWTLRSLSLCVSQICKTLTSTCARQLAQMNFTTRRPTTTPWQPSRSMLLELFWKHFKSSLVMRSNKQEKRRSVPFTPSTFNSMIQRKKQQSWVSHLPPPTI